MQTKKKIYRNCMTTATVAGGLTMILLSGSIFRNEAEESCFLKLKGGIFGLNGKIFMVDEREVALSNKIMEWKPPLSVISEGAHDSIISWSLSMWWDSVNNIFLNEFPFTGTTNNFNYRIKFTILKKINDSLTIPVDSTTQGKFTIVIQKGAVTPDTFQCYCWDRSFSFFQNGIKLTQVTSATTPLEIRFAYDSGAARYNYSKASVEVRTKGINNHPDKEYLSLTKNGAIFTGAISLKSDSGVAPLPNDGLLQVNKTDMIYAVFRNSETAKLPLDTLIDSIPFSLFTGIQSDKVNPAPSFFWYAARNPNGNTTVSFKPMQQLGEVSVVTTNGRCVLRRNLLPGDNHVVIPSIKSPSLFIVQVNYGNVKLKRKVFIP